MSRHVNVLIPAAGSSRRFAEVGILRPKGTIPFRWRQGPRRSMIEQVAYADHMLSQSALYFVGINDPGLVEREYWDTVPMPKVQTGPTRGQAHTVLLMLHALSLDDEPVLVLNSDNAFTYPLSVFVSQAIAYPGAALVTRSRNRAYSYVSGMPLFYTAREKEPISQWAMAGAYFFPQGRDLRRAIERQMAANAVHNGEFYLSGALTYMMGAAMLAVPIDRSQWHCWGTPEELARDPEVQIDDPEVATVLAQYR